MLKSNCFLKVLFSPSTSDHSRIFRSSPKSTLFWSDRSPISLRSGRGSRLMSVGTATICSSLARFACRQMSMISRSYRPFKCCSQTCLIFSTASFDFNVDPFMYKRKTYFARRECDPGCSISLGDLGFRFPAAPVFFGGFFMWIFLSFVRLPVAGPSQSTSARCWKGLQ